MRRAFLPILPLALLLLLAGTWWAWQHRFEIDPAHPHLTLHDLERSLALEPGAAWEAAPGGETGLVLHSGTTSHPAVQLLPLPLSGPVQFLMFDFAVQARGLTPGPMPWSDGRLMIEWHAPGKPMDPQYLAAARSDQSSGSACLVVRCHHGPAVPVLRVEHLGTSGSFHVPYCRIDTVRESAWWTVGRWFLLGGWFTWTAVLAGWGRTSGPGRPLLAAGVWLFCASQWAVPGPWQSLRPLGPFFAVSEPAGRASFTAPAAPPQKSPASQAGPASAAPAEALGELPFGGSLLLEIKDRIKQARPLFHLLLFFGPALVFALLIGRRKSVLFAALLAGVIEGSQYLFGYGFDSSDWFDLSFDSLGVVLALFVHARVSRWWQARKAASEFASDETSSASQPT
ncbi:hypothetical protein OKA05_13405 [Luteolibacter arcticus]|uniref:VanZ-like domain-containing protein n=1 Tax=Luteolibacter arcticus TaxID=1581411 RepID=A0ABT3GJ83_9BACT|nr:hypothetical protein [Luteolibacter arcticus]MCW1923555.1 hypothetical protein [Luteolibacter arcticus]